MHKLFTTFKNEFKHKNIKEKGNQFFNPLFSKKERPILSMYCFLHIYLNLHLFKLHEKYEIAYKHHFFGCNKAPSTTFARENMLIFINFIF